jgi:hypothetical protein
VILSGWFIWKIIAIGSLGKMYRSHDNDRACSMCKQPSNCWQTLQETAQRPIKIDGLYVMKVLGDSVSVINSAEDFSDIGFFMRWRAIQRCRSEVKRLAATPSRPEILAPSVDRGWAFHERRGLLAVAAVVTTADYPPRVAQVVLRALLDECGACNGSFPNGQSSVVHHGIAEYQDPQNVAQIMTIQERLEEAHEIMVANLEEPLTAGDRIDDMLQLLEAMESNKPPKCCVA